MAAEFSRRRLLTLLAGGAAVLSLPRRSAAQAKPGLVVYKDPSCGCCQQWVVHMQSNGYTAKVNNVSPMDPIKVQHKIPQQLQSCHTTLVGGYVIEGHVPASDIARLLKEKPKGILGLTIPGMPQSAPGMDLKPFQPYVVLTFDAQGKTTEYARHDKA
jgi:hypothetical protein